MIEALTPEQIKTRLQEVGMTQKQLAEKLEMQPARLSEMINGKREIPEEVERDVIKYITDLRVDIAMPKEAC